MDPAGIQDEYSERAGARNGEGESKPPWRAVRMGGKLLLDSGGAVGVDGEAVVSRAAFALDAGAVWEIGGKGGGGHGLTSQMARRRDTTSAPLAKLKAWARSRSGATSKFQSVGTLLDVPYEHGHSSPFKSKDGFYRPCRKRTGVEIHYLQLFVLHIYHTRWI